MESMLLGEDLKKLWPLIDETQSDSASFDNCLELLVAEIGRASCRERV